MKRMLLLAFAIMTIASCQNVQKKDSPKTLEEVEYFYWERTSSFQYIHVDPECGTNCVYLDKARIRSYDDHLCGKCISKELAREIMSKQ